ncbi:nicotinate (nicotinamide) nucleotide adenylyltransferase [Helicobacter sp. 12S02232-10]|uniref:nicotinate (nicotinamide) nucleotide adenylyltransferase n=1 Tax=Helicobacter sp. 12S02232-10 TaxID=1476197 RepID=UPI000BA75AAD|nr:nicotinate (nicotinamide) nucleotide adenylyltransferase [Helicobacter sp. 12S02232-10]PAF50009.1 nicotinate (nicotinamide) nucleotide adenylyltransferase [Helicobacter sp. 12S02232-10]
MNIAIYGGSFDPPHTAHLQIIQTALEKLDIDKLIVIVAYQNPFKKPCLFSAEERYEWMVQLNKNLTKVEVSNMEIIQKKPIASIRSVLNIKEKFNPKKIYFIIGEDNLPNLHKWHRYEELKELVEFVIIEREGYEAQTLETLRKISLPNLKYKISSSQIKKNLSINQFSKDLPENIKTEVIKSYKELH